MDVAQFTSKERKQARKNLLRKIDTYNKQARKATRHSAQTPAFPISSPSKDLVYKGIVKVKYDRGYAIQTKSLLLENTTTAAEAIEQLFEALGLPGNPKDYALEERNILSGENRLVDHKEIPLNLQLNDGGHNLMELQVVQVRDSRSFPTTKGRPKSRGASVDGESSDDTLSEGSNPNLVPKEEVIDHGVSQIETLMEEALQDIPPLVLDIQERLKGISESVAVDGKPRSGLPSRRLLWERLKPQASSLVKDIRRLVDSGEFLANKHCKNSPVVKLIITLLLELITDHSRELVTITKEMCGLRGAAKTDFDASVSQFTQQVTYISKLVGKTNDCLSSMAITGHLLTVTAPENFQSGKLTGDSYFSGSKSVSGVLLFSVVTAYLGLVRAAYEEKCEYYVNLATNMLRSSQRALETIQKTEEYAMLHLHPLRSRVMDMDHKLRVAMDNLIRKVRVASSSRPPPDASCEMLHFGYSLIMSTLDFLMVAQCASLVHKVAIAGWELMQFPWVRAIAEAGNDADATAAGARSAFADQLSSLGSDSTGSQSTGGDSSIYKGIVTTPEKASGIERRSRIHGLSISQHRESGDGMDALEMANTEHKMLRTSQVIPQYDQFNSMNSTDETPSAYDAIKPAKVVTNEKRESYVPSDVESQGSMAVSVESGKVSTREDATMHSNTDQESSHYMGIDAVKKLRQSYIINKAIVRGAESLLMTLTQKVNLLSVVCRNGSKEKYVGISQQIANTCREMREEVASMEVEILVGESMAEHLDKTKTQLDSNLKELQAASIMASSSAMSAEGGNPRLLSVASRLKESSSKMVADALKKVAEHKKALEEAEKIEKEFMTLVTGHRRSSVDHGTSVPEMRKTTSRVTLTGESDSEGLLFEETKMNPLAGLGRGFVAKEAPRVIAGTIPNLLQRLTYHRVMDLEFNDTFLTTFSSFMSPIELLNYLQERFEIQPSEDLPDSDVESYMMDVIIPVQLRVVQSLRKWLQTMYDDLKDEALSKKLDTFISTIQKVMPSCGRQLQSLREANQTGGPVFLQNKPQSTAPTPLIPVTLSTGVDFDLLDVNSLELSRQLTITYFGILQSITPRELLSVGWNGDSRETSAPCIGQFMRMSSNLAKVVANEVNKETIDDQQASVISYFILTGKNCHELKNYEALFAIIEGLESKSVKQATTAWQMVTEQLKMTFVELREVVSAELNYSKYKEEICSVYLTPCIPKLSLILGEIEALDLEYPATMPDKKDMVNFERCRNFARAIQHIQRYQSISYNFHPIAIMQLYLGNLKKSLTEEEIDKLSTKIESFTI